MIVHYLMYITQYIIIPNSKLTGYPVQWITNIHNECLDKCRYIITIPQSQDGDFVVKKYQEVKLECIIITWRLLLAKADQNILQNLLI